MGATPSVALRGVTRAPPIKADTHSLSEFSSFYRRGSKVRASWRVRPPRPPLKITPHPGIFSFLSSSRHPDFVSEVGTARTWTLTGYLALGESADITFDASPFGLGAILETAGSLVAYVESRLMPEDARKLGQSIGSSKG